ncbi:uncharacterized protein LOC127094341 [Lathyrus oleraceus]|uniref:uncharacterized protein LOC127094341 n=1 Tax=Pisum sativum TaxID=3888 RepID=UPI0021D14BD5|nr:uncharacterized protein LOC127094341 [Pisum sativum]
MAEAPPPPAERLLGNYGGANSPTGRLTIVNQSVNVDHFQLHPSTIRQLERRPFSGKINEDANKHLQRFMTMTTSLKIEGHSEEAKKLVMFPFTLSEDVEDWFYSLPAGSITAWQQIETTFLNEYFPTSVYIHKRYDIVNFKQKEGESLGDAYKRFKRFVSQPEGIIDLKLANPVVKMEDQITAEVERRLKKMTLDTQTEARVQPVQPIQVVSCEICEGPHFTMHCVATAQQDQQGNAQKQAPTQYLSQPQQQYRPQQQQPYQQQQFHQSQQQFQQQVPRKTDWEIAIEKMAAQSSQFQEETRSNLRNTGASIKNLEVQMSQIAQQLADDDQEDQLLEVDLEIKENEVVSEEVTVPKLVVKEKVSESKSVVKLLFPIRNKKKKQHEKNFVKFLEMFKKLEINIPFLEALEQMPSYAKFMKDIISKRRSTDTDSIVLTETCSAILQGMKIPVKKKDRGSISRAYEMVLFWSQLSFATANAIPLTAEKDSTSMAWSVVTEKMAKGFGFGAFCS